MTTMRTFTPAELTTILDAHWKWLRGETGGSRADLTGANLTDADLEGADLTGANLAGADLTGANLAGADLAPIRIDLYVVLDSAPAEVPGLLSALREGRVDGTTYSGDCACLVGTIANVRGCNYEKLGTLKPDSYRPAERWFLGIGRGSTPATNQVAAITEGWVVEWMAAHANESGGTLNHALPSIG